jgi:hypothetical protein
VRLRNLDCTVLALCVAVSAALSVAAAAAPAATWTLADPKGDDYGDGIMKYPMRDDMREGDLDLVELSAEAADDGTWFTVTMRRPVRAPGAHVIDSLGRTAAEIAKYGFYEFNVDIYVDTDRVEGSGQTWCLPGRKVTIDPRTAWEKVISLTPQPEQAALLVRSMLARTAKAEAKANKPRSDKEDERIAREYAYNALESDFWFPRTVQVAGNRVKFFVPNSFLAGPARDTFAYTVAVTGANLEPRFDTGSLVGSWWLETDYLLIPVWAGLSDKHFSGRDDDKLQPPIVDIIVPAGQKQEDILKDYDLRIDKMVQLTGVVPKDAPGAAAKP